jgi:ADP-ribosylglycohydrolase
VNQDLAIATFLGLAIGDSMGRPTEFVSSDRVRTMHISTAPGQFRWTDDTHMAMHLAGALAGFYVDPKSHAVERRNWIDAFGEDVAQAWVDWHGDPAKAGTAPGGTCSAGAMALRRGESWRTSGVRTSDGCGAVMRICPIAIALNNAQKGVNAAYVQAVATHAHPNATDGAVLGVILHADALGLNKCKGDQRAAFLSELRELAESWGGKGPDTKPMLQAVVALADEEFEWLPESKVPAGDGGWRTTSALGLGLLAAVKWGFDAQTGRVTAESFQLAVEKAARTYGDSDSIACLTGMYLGAIGGLDVVKAHPGYDAIRDREVIEELARAVYNRRKGADPVRLDVAHMIELSRA